MSKYRIVITTEIKDGEGGGDILFYEEGENINAFREMAEAFTDNKAYCKDLVNQMEVIAVRISIDIKQENGDGWHTILNSLEFV